MANRDNINRESPRADTSSGSAAPAQPVADWAQIELDYRAGIKSLRQIASEQGISEGAIRKRAKRDGWSRDLAPRIQSKAEELVRKQAVRSEVRAERTATESQVVEANARAVADVRLAHRRDISRGRDLVMRLMDELDLQTGPETIELLENLGDLLRAEDDKGVDKLNDLYRKIISLPGRAKTAKDLTESMRVLVTLERQAFGMDSPNQDAPSSGAVKQMTDAERAVRLMRLLQDKGASFGAAAKILAGESGE